MSDQDVVLNDSHPEAEAGVDEEDEHEDVVEDSVAVIIGTAVQKVPQQKIYLIYSI